MIEIPRAALTADRIAEHAEFFSFGTNDLTQMTMGLSRDECRCRSYGSRLEVLYFSKGVGNSLCHRWGNSVLD
jgi:phosphoenolpyruvate synthase/pyruvate phosphate dikinase